MVLAEISHNLVLSHIGSELKPDLVYPSEYNFPWDTDHLFFNPGHNKLLDDNGILSLIDHESFNTEKGSWIRVPVTPWILSEMKTDTHCEKFFHAVMNEMNQLPYSFIVNGINKYTEKLKQEITPEQEHQYLIMRSNNINEWYIYFIKHNAAHHLIQCLEDTNAVPDVQAYHALKKKTDDLFPLPYYEGQVIDTIDTYIQNICLNLNQ